MKTSSFTVTHRPLLLHGSTSPHHTSSLCLIEGSANFPQVQQFKLTAHVNMEMAMNPVLDAESGKAAGSLKDKFTETITDATETKNKDRRASLVVRSKKAIDELIVHVKKLPMIELEQPKGQKQEEPVKLEKGELEKGELEKLKDFLATKLDMADLWYQVEEENYHLVDTWLTQAGLSLKQKAKFITDLMLRDDEVEIPEFSCCDTTKFCKYVAARIKNGALWKFYSGNYTGDDAEQAVNTFSLVNALFVSIPYGVIGLYGVDFWDAYIKSMLDVCACVCVYLFKLVPCLFLHASSLHLYTHIIHLLTHTHTHTTTSLHTQLKPSRTAATFPVLMPKNFFFQITTSSTM